MHESTIFGAVAAKSDILHLDNLLKLNCLLVIGSELHHLPLIFFHCGVKEDYYPEIVFELKHVPFFKGIVPEEGTLKLEEDISDIDPLSREKPQFFTQHVRLEAGILEDYCNIARLWQIRVWFVEIEYKVLVSDTSEVEERYLAHCVSDVSESYKIDYSPANHRQCLNFYHSDIPYIMIN